MIDISRRTFLQGGAMSTLAVASGCRAFNIGYSDPRWPLPSERINLAVIGCGTMGKGNMYGFLRDKRVRVTVTCDPVKDSPAYGYDADWKKKFRGGREAFAGYADNYYKAKGCRSVTDWREVIDDPTIDAVLIATTDHWHAIIAAAAMRAGKHVYCQKPLTMSIAEGRHLSDIAKETGVVFQVGSQQRSAKEFREAAEIVRNGILEGCTTCSIGLSYAHNDSHRNGFVRNGNRMKTRPDYWRLTDDEWNLWQGPAQHWEDNAFIPGIHGPMVWRWNDRTGNGALPDWGAHHLDILQWALGTEFGGPIRVENVTSDYATATDEVFNWPGRFSFDVVYENGFRAKVSDSDTAAFCGLKFHSPKGDLFVTRGKIEKPSSLSKWQENDLKGNDVRLHKSRGSHESDFIDAIYDRNWTCACTCETGHRSITISHLANSCIKTGTKSITWDPVRETSDNAAVNDRFDIKRYNGWSLTERNG